MVKNNVIDLRSRLKKQKGTKSKEQLIPSSGTESIEPQAGTPVLDITQRREAMISDERRQVRRTLLTGFIGAFVVIPQKSGTAKGGLLKVDIYDISENGIAFDMPLTAGHFKSGEEVAMRVYLSNDTYFPFTAFVQNFRKLEGDPTYRHGAKFVQGTVNDEALHHFVKFIETVSASLEKDRGDVLVSNLKK